MNVRSAKRNLHSVVAMRDFVRLLRKNKSLAPGLGIALMQFSKELDASFSFWNHAEKVSHNEYPRYEKLQIGGGKCFLDGFVNLDVVPPADVVWDCRYGLPFPGKSFKFVFSEHFLEHIDYPISTKKVLSGIYQVLQPNGKLLLGVPDGGRVAKLYAGGKSKFLYDLYRRIYRKRHPRVEIYGALDIVNYLFRDQVENPKYTMHFWAYDHDSLMNLLLSIGFRIVRKAKFDPRYCNPKRKSYTIYVEATK